mmetsp:Transcript_18034/g.58072  ORF Transcript_18034/g.58072 Transcript_18034/m.58072 type:complete len:136 (+) Transcript_18034:332-739(+)
MQRTRGRPRPSRCGKSSASQPPRLHRDSGPGLATLRTTLWRAGGRARLSCPVPAPIDRPKLRSVPARPSTQEERTLLDRKLIDEKYPKQNRFSKTGEDFRKKEARKRKMGQQNSGGDWVQEEKRRIRHAGMNCDS